MKGVELREVDAETESRKITKEKEKIKKKKRRSGMKQFRSLKSCKICGFTTRDHLKRHIMRWHNVKEDTAKQMAKEAAKKVLREPPPLVRSLIEEEMGPFAHIPDCMERLERLLRKANVRVVDALPPETASEHATEDAPEQREDLVDEPAAIEERTGPEPRQHAGKTSQQAASTRPGKEECERAVQRGWP